MVRVIDPRWARHAGAGAHTGIAGILGIAGITGITGITGILRRSQSGAKAGSTVTLTTGGARPPPRITPRNGATSA